MFRCQEMTKKDCRKIHMKKIFLKISDSKYGLIILSLMAFFESVILPIPPDILMTPLIIQNKNRALLLSSIVTFFSVLGGVFAYAVGLFFFETIGTWIINTYKLTNTFNGIQSKFLDYGFWIISCKGILPFVPYKLIALTSGITGFPIKSFLIASIIGRGTRFAFLGISLYYFGPQIKIFVLKNQKLIVVLSLFILIFVFFIIKLILKLL